ncbi:MAG: (4Fe-4S)-binding protein [Methyloceanibacter sp.]|jgi:uncharacterized Fe-S cluster protein YjdI|uniref:(4Fe-4S)-binding protein n=1 Tax=Methyloceanibacter sp. TaxID=1965321 RepID=UPI003C491471
MTKHKYENDHLTVFFDPEVCIHAGDCVRGLPSVFDVAKKPWINVDGAPYEGIIEQIKQCPSGALGYKLSKSV